MIRAAAVLGLLSAFYVLFAGQVSGTEAIAGLGALLVTAAYGLALHHCAPFAIGLRAPWPRVIAATLRSIVVDTAHVGWVLLRGGSGSVARQDFDCGKRSEANAGRAAITTLALSLAPNGYVVRVHDDALLLHRLRPQPASPDRVWPL